jgi:methionyl-tRNA synthetase
MPSRAAELLDGLGVKQERRTVDFACKNADLEYGAKPVPKEGWVPNPFQSLFPPVAGIELPDEEAVINTENSKEHQSSGQKTKRVKNRLGRVVQSLTDKAQPYGVDNSTKSPRGQRNE